MVEGRRKGRRGRRDGVCIFFCWLGGLVRRVDG